MVVVILDTANVIVVVAVSFTVIVFVAIVFGSFVVAVTHTFRIVIFICDAKISV